MSPASSAVQLSHLLKVNKLQRHDQAGLHNYCNTVFFCRTNDKDVYLNKTFAKKQKPSLIISWIGLCRPYFTQRSDKM